MVNFNFSGVRNSFCSFSLINFNFDKTKKRNKVAPIYPFLGVYAKFYIAYKRVGKQFIGTANRKNVNNNNNLKT